jgi:gluconate 2-dehydrogenase subunit 3-like protein
MTSERYPGFDPISQASKWDPVTAELVLGRLAPPPAFTFFTAGEQPDVTVLADLLTGQRAEQLVPVAQLIDQRLAAGETDGWRYEDMPEDGQAWRDSLAGLAADAQDRFGAAFAGCAPKEQEALLQAVQELGSQRWHGLVAAHVWSLWTRYACTAFYAHPAAWAEIGFPGPAYPRGYKNIGLDAREPFEVADVRPASDPVKGGS